MQDGELATVLHFGGEQLPCRPFQDLGFEDADPAIAVAVGGVDWAKRLLPAWVTESELVAYNCDSDSGEKAGKIAVGAAFSEVPLP